MTVELSPRPTPQPPVTACRCELRLLFASETIYDCRPGGQEKNEKNRQKKISSQSAPSRPALHPTNSPARRAACMAPPVLSTLPHPARFSAPQSHLSK